MFGELTELKLNSMCHYKELSFIENVNDLQKFKKGQIIDVKIIEVKDEKLKLSIKRLQKDPFEYFNEKKYKVQIANDNSEGQIVLSGKNTELLKLGEILKSKNIKNIKLPVSAPFHCYLMSKATEVMKKEIENTNFQDSKNILISNVTANEINSKDDLKRLLIDQIENRVRWRESVLNMIKKGVNQFIEIGPGKVLSGLVKRIDKNVKINTINNESDIKELKI